MLVGLVLEFFFSATNDRPALESIPSTKRFVIDPVLCMHVTHVRGVCISKINSFYVYVSHIHLLHLRDRLYIIIVYVTFSSFKS
jgi:hypothetical protein